jgi:hypothetical protein
MAMCSMCPTVALTDVHAPRKGWQCVCGEVNCAHYLNCSKCQQSRYRLETDKRLKNGRPVAKD